MASGIASVRDSYGRFMEILPEELDDNLAQQLANARTHLNEIVTQDRDSVNKLLVDNNLNLSLSDFENPQHTIRNAFLLRNEQFNRNSETIKFFLGQWTMSKDVLTYLANEMMEIIPQVRRQFTDFKNLVPQRRERRMAFIDLTRTYQGFIGCAVNIQDVIEDYEEVFDFLVKRIKDPNYNFKPKRKISRISHTELFAGARELLLRGNHGRFTPPPLIRSALEVIISRTMLDPNHSSKYSGQRVEVQKGFGLSDLLNAADKFKYPFAISTDAVRRMYEWGNISTHRAWRMRHSEMWYTLVNIQQITQGILAIEDNEVSKAWDDILDELIKNNLIKIV
jgi:hypothetical protein